MALIALSSCWSVIGRCGYTVYIFAIDNLPAVFVQGAETATVCSDMVWKEEWPVNRFNCFAKLRICQDAAYKMPLPFWTAIANWLPRGAAWKLHEVAFSNANVWKESLSGIFLKYCRQWLFGPDRILPLLGHL